VARGKYLYARLRQAATINCKRRTAQQENEARPAKPIEQEKKVAPDTNEGVDMKKTLLILFAVIFLFSGCSEYKKYNMKKDANEYIELLSEFRNSIPFKSDRLTENGAISVLIWEMGFNADLTIKKKSILQKYQGDALVEFSKILRDEFREKFGEELHDALLLILIEEEK
jgi:hypothetical protein